MFIKHNENRDGRNVGDCTVRAISTALNQTWEKTYWGLCVEGAAQADMPSSNRVWGAYLKKRGFRRRSPPDDVTVGDFGDSDFLQAVRGKDCTAVFNVIDELMDTLRITAPRVYSGVMRKISAL